MSEERGMIERFEAWAGLAPGSAAPTDQAGSASPAPATSADANAEDQDARKLAEICLRLRSETELAPAADLWDRLQARVDLYQNAAAPLPGAREAWENLADVGPQDGADEPSFSQLFELCSGTLPDAQADAVERRLATSPEAQKSVRAAGQLAAALNQLRSETGLQATPDALARFQARVQHECQEQFTASAEAWAGVASSSPLASSTHNSSWAPAATQAPRRKSRPRITWFSLAATVLLALGLWQIMLAQGDITRLWPFQQQPMLAAADRPVYSQVEKARTVADLRGLRSPLAAVLGQALLRLESPARDSNVEVATSPDARVRAESLADWHLAADLSLRANRQADVDTVRFLVRERREASAARPAKSVAHAPAMAAAMPVGLPWESVAYGDDDVSQWSLDKVRQAAGRALDAGDFKQVDLLCQNRAELPLLLTRIWALAAAGRPDREVLTLVSQLESSGLLDRAPLAARTFVAGMYRTLREPATAAKRLELLVDEAPALAFHVGQLFDRELQNEQAAAAWFARLNGAQFGAYRTFGLAQARQTVLFEERFTKDLRRWERGGSNRASFSILPEVGSDVLHQTEISQLPDVGWLAAGDSTWKDYEVRLDFRFNEVAVGDPQIGIFGYFQNEEENYRLAISRESLGFRRREPRSWGGYETISWPKLEPRIPTLGVGVWYSARFRLENVEGGTRLSAKVWPRDSVEPAEWMLVSEDANARPYDAGRIGLLISDCGASIAHVRVLSIGGK